MINKCDWTDFNYYRLSYISTVLTCYICHKTQTMLYLFKYLVYGGGEVLLFAVEMLSDEASRGGTLGEFGNSLILLEVDVLFDLLQTESKMTCLLTITQILQNP